MNTTSRAGWLAIALLCFANMTYAQTTIAEDLQRADKQLDLYAYNLAMKSYKQVLEKDPNNGHALERIADCYFQLNQADEAVNWYKRAIEQREPNSDVQLRYGKVLMYKGNYEQAKKEFLEYASLNDNANEAGRHFAEMCDYALRTTKKTPEYAARNEALNTAAADFSPVFLGARVVYSSARTDIVRKTQSKNTSDWTGSSYNQLFVTQRNPENGSLQKPDFLRNDLQNNYNEGPVSFSSDGKKVAFCRNNFVNGTRQIAVKGVDMSLYIGDVVNGEWVNVKAFPYNGTDYATGFPCLIGVGNTLVYASNNPATTTGGKGWDIYISHLVNGEWSTPRNLGAPVNTPGNEVTPYYDGADLYFSSDWQNGLGGLDVFRAEVGKESVKNVYHLGPGINSSADDYGFVFSSQTQLGYLTSNRPGGRGNEDIWQISKTDNVAPAPTAYSTPSSSRSLSDVMAGRTASSNGAQGQAKSAFTPDNQEESSIQSHYLIVTDDFGKPLPGVDVDMYECSGERGQTDMEGKFYFSPSYRQQDCMVEISKSGYERTQVEVKEFGQRNITASLGFDKRQEFTGTVVDARTKQPLSDVTVDFTDNGKTIRTNTDQYGKYALLLAPGTTYTVEYSRYGYNNSRVPLRPLAAGNYKLNDVPLTSESNAGYTAPALSTNQPAPNNTTSSQFANPAASQFANPAASQQPTQYSTPSTNRTTKSPETAPTVLFAPPTTTSTSTTRLLTANQPETQPEFNGYSIQVAATPTTAVDNDTKKYESLAKYGHVYSKTEDNKNKVRLGIFPTREEAQKTLKEVNKNQQFKGAFVVEERGADPSLVMSSKQNKAAAPAQYSTSTSTARNVSAAPSTVKAPTNTVCYAIQLNAAPSNKSISVGNYTNISDLGNIYGKVENNSVRMRMGVWNNYEDAELALAQVIEKGYNDAIIVTEKSGDESIKDFIITKKGPVTQAQPVVTPNDGSKYYIRLCAISDPSRFDANQLEGAGVNGTIEKWPVGSSGLTAIVLAGYTNFEAANSDKQKVKTQGFPDAFVARELNGVVTRMK